MARLTFAEIVTQGGILGGNDAVGTWITTKLKAWLRKHYAHYPWPFLMTTTTAVALPAASTGLTVGAGSGGLTPQISRIFAPIYWRETSNVNNRGKCPIVQQIAQSGEQLAALVDTNITGVPRSFVAQDVKTAAGLFQILLTPYPQPDRAYSLSFQYQKMPDDNATTDVPLYPNELTLIQAAKCAAIEYDNSNTDWWRSESDILASMVAADRDAYGGNASFGDSHQLDSSVFGTQEVPSTKLPWS